MAKLTYNGVRARWEWVGGYHTRFQPQGSGFRWDADNKVWHTSQRERAYMLRRFADSLAKAELGEFTRETMNSDRREAVLVGLKMLASRDTDWAKLLNGVGYSKADTLIGHQLASKESLNSEQAELGIRIIALHRYQLPEELLRNAGAIRREKVAV